MDFFILIIKLIFALILVFGLMFIALKYSRNSISKFGNKRYAKVIDRIQISKDSCVIIMKLGEEGLVILSNSGHSETLKKLSKEEIEVIEKQKAESYENMSHAFDKIKKKIKSKEDKYEKNKEQK